MQTNAAYDPNADTSDPNATGDGQPLELDHLDHFLNSMTPEHLAVIDRLLGVEHPPTPTPAPAPVPKQGFGSRLVGAFSGLENQPQAAPKSFLEGLVGGAIHGVGAAGTRAQAARAQLEQQFEQKQAAVNAQNLKATDEYNQTRGKGREMVVGKLIDEAGKAPPKAATPVAVMGPDGKPVYAAPGDAVGKQPYEKPEKAGAPVAIMDPKTGKAKFVSAADALGQQPAKSADAAAAFDPHDYVDPDKADTSTLGYAYVNKDALPDKKQQTAAVDLARKQGVPVITAKEKSGLDLVDKARGHFVDLAASIGMPLPADANGNVTSWRVPELNNYKGPLATNQTDLGRAIKPLEQISGIGKQADVLKNMKSFSDLAITAVQGMSALGTGMRINKDVILQTLRNNIPQAGDTADQARNKINQTINLLNETERTLLHAKNAAQAKQQAAGHVATRMAATAPAAPVPGGFFDTVLNGGHR